jgi:hypothetical protein
VIRNAGFDARTLIGRRALVHVEVLAARIVAQHRIALIAEQRPEPKSTVSRAFDRERAGQIVVVRFGLIWIEPAVHNVSVGQDDESGGVSTVTLHHLRVA